MIRISDTELTLLSFFGDFLSSLPSKEVEKNCKNSGVKKILAGMATDAQELARAIICVASGKKYAGKAKYKKRAESMLAQSRAYIAIAAKRKGGKK